MGNYTRNVVTSQETGEITDEYYTNDTTRFYKGPRKYWRIMEDYDKAQLLLASKVGVQIMVYLKTKLDTTNYRIQINHTWLSNDIGTNRETVARNIKKLIDNNYLIKEARGIYFVNPKLFWSQDINDEQWQELKKEFYNT